MNTLKSIASWLWSLRNEITLGIIALIGFLNLAGWLRAFDPTAAGLDIGTLTIPAIGIVAVLCGVLLFWVLWRFCFPGKIDEWFDRPEGFLTDFFAATPAVRLACFFGSLWAVLLAVGLCAMSLR